MSQRRNDPQRRERIVQAALRVIARDGVAGCTHRSVAAEAGVPLGSMTYHFDSRHALIEEAFTLLAQQMHDGWVTALSVATTPAGALEVLVDWIHGQHYATGGRLEMMVELYVYAARRPEASGLITGWAAQVQQTLQRFFPPVTAKALDAVIEGVMLQSAYSDSALSRGQVAVLLQQVAGMEAG